MRVFFLTFVVSAVFSFCLGLSGTAQANQTKPPVSQAYLSAYDLKTYCFSGYDTDFGFCAGYVTGVADLMLEHTIYGFEGCNMQMVRSQQMVDLVKNYMNNHPEHVEGNARLLVARALAKSFPCF